MAAASGAANHNLTFSKLKVDDSEQYATSSRQSVLHFPTASLNRLPRTDVNLGRPRRRLSSSKTGIVPYQHQVFGRLFVHAVIDCMFCSPGWWS
jgi:hypothetical protein